MKRFIGLAAMGLVMVQLAAQEAKKIDMPLDSVVLYSSGVGTFVHSGFAENDGVVTLSLDEAQLNDTLKSLLLLSESGVTVEAINYPTKLPLSELLKNARVNLQQNSTLQGILSQMRGMEFKISLNGGSEYVGRFLGSSEISLADNRRETVLDFMVGDMMRRFRLDEIQSVLPTDPEVLKDMRSSLAVISAAGNKSAKELKIRLKSPDKKRAMRLAYVIASPVWKASYRLILSDNDRNKSHLQAWAMVENPTTENWNNVKLSLVSGKPSSFVQDLYSSIYVKRPIVSGNYGGIAPVFYDAGVQVMPQLEELRDGEVKKDYNVSKMRMSMMNVSRMEEKSLPAMMSMDENADATEYVVAGGTDSGTLVSKPGNSVCRYNVKTPVNLGSRESAMLELLTLNLPVEKLSIYNCANNTKYPLNALIINNESTMLLPQGPITIFSEDNTYSGDAAMPDVTANQKQLVSYGLDQEVLVTQLSSNKYNEGVINGIKVENGMLNSFRKRIITNKYNFFNKANQTKKMILEQAKNLPAVLSEKSPVPAEVTENLYRFKLELPAGKGIDFEIQEEQVLSRQYALNGDLTRVLLDLQGADLSMVEKNFIAGLTLRNTKVKDLQQEVEDMNKRYQELTETYQRNRETYRTLSSSETYRSTLLARLEKLDKELLSLNDDKERKIEALRNAQKDLNKFIQQAKI